jgi:hypothetical protein
MINPALLRDSATEGSAADFVPQHPIKVSPGAVSNVASKASYNPSILFPVIDQAVGEVFDRKAEQWLEDTQWLSSVSAITRHPLYEEIVVLSRPAVRRILARMQQGDIHVHWFPVLRDITGSDPVPPHKRGRIREMAAEWLDWGRANHLL